MTFRLLRQVFHDERVMIIFVKRHEVKRNVVSFSEKKC